MRLTMILLKKKLPNGHIFRGKYRLVKPVSERACDTLMREYAVEEQNMFYLRHPYLTLEQSQGHAKDLNKKEQWLDNFRKIRTTYKDPVTLEQHYGHLRCKEIWD